MQQILTFCKSLPTKWKSYVKECTSASMSCSIAGVLKVPWHDYRSLRNLLLPIIITKSSYYLARSCLLSLDQITWNHQFRTKQGLQWHAVLPIGCHLVSTVQPVNWQSNSIRNLVIKFQWLKDYKNLLPMQSMLLLPILWQHFNNVFCFSAQAHSREVVICLWTKLIS